MFYKQCAFHSDGPFLQVSLYLSMCLGEVLFPNALIREVYFGNYTILVAMYGSL